MSTAPYYVNSVRFETNREMFREKTLIPQVNRGLNQKKFMGI